MFFSRARTHRPGEAPLRCRSYPGWAPRCIPRCVSSGQNTTGPPEHAAGGQPSSCRLFQNTTPVIHAAMHSVVIRGGSPRSTVLPHAPVANLSPNPERKTSWNVGLGRQSPRLYSGYASGPLDRHAVPSMREQIPPCLEAQASAPVCPVKSCGCTSRLMSADVTCWCSSTPHAALPTQPVALMHLEPI